jgi:membrane protein implicated in regulation of membrane protease activity
MSPSLLWLLAGVALLIAELLAPGVFMMWLGLAALATGGLSLAVDLALAWQVVSFAIFAAVALGVFLRLRRRAKPPLLNTAQAGLIGRAARVLAVNGPDLRVRIGDSDWSARPAHGAVTEVGRVLRVVAVDGTVVVVGD